MFVVFLYNNYSSNFGIALEVLLSFKSNISMLYENRSFEEIYQCVSNVELEVNFLNKMLLVTESEKRFRTYRIISGDGTCFNNEHGYMYLKEGNSQEVHCGEGIHRVIILVSLPSVRDEDLEAGAEIRLENFKLVESVQRNQLTFDRSQRSGVEFDVISHNVEIFKCLREVKVMKTIDNVDLDVVYSERFTKDGKLKAEAEVLLYICDNPKGNYNFNVLDVEVNLLFDFKMVFGTEGEKRVRFYRIICGDVDIFIDGHGYINFEKGNSQEVHRGEGFCRVYFCIILLSVNEDNLEAEAITRQEVHKLTKMVIVVSNNFQKGEREFESCSYNNVLSEAGIYSVFLKRFNRSRVFIWLIHLLLIAEAFFLAGSGFSTS
jgi:hypothetical protein